MASSNQKQLAIEEHSLQADEFAAKYDRMGQKNGSESCFIYSRHRLDDYLDRYLPIGGGVRVLDLGCGTGHYLERLRQRSFEVAGMDGSAEMIMHARSRNPQVDIRQGDVERIPFPDCSFDYVLCIEVLRYLPERRHCLREIWRVLKPGGVCLVTAAPALNLNGYWLVNRLATRVKIGNLVRLKQFFATCGQLKREFRTLGFVEVKVHGVYLGPINWIERLLPSMLSAALRLWEPFDRVLADRWAIREFANMFLVYGARGPAQ